jgi:hypothetical protein
MAEHERTLTLLDHLERRRSVLEQAMWQAPTLTIAAQAFLLFVLAGSAIDATARKVVLVAGIAACFAAVISLLRLHEREVRYSEAIAHYLNTLGIADPRPDALPRRSLRRRGFWSWFDGGLRALGGWSWLPPIHVAWIAALLLFIAADVLAYHYN